VVKLEKKIVYFEKAGKINTDDTLRVAEKRALDLGLTNIVLATSRGYTAERAIELYKDSKLKVIVMGTNRETISKDLVQNLEIKNIPLRFCNEIEYIYPDHMRNAFRKISEGFKVCMEICMAAVHEGLIPEGKEVVAVAGTSPLGFDGGGGADTAVVLIPKSPENFLIVPEKAKRREIKEIICKPR
jgi:hypothetical protein